MDETFMLFLNDIPAESQGFVLNHDAIKMLIRSELGEL